MYYSGEFGIGILSSGGLAILYGMLINHGHLD